MTYYYYNSYSNSCKKIVLIKIVNIYTKFGNIKIMLILYIIHYYNLTH